MSVLLWATGQPCVVQLTVLTFQAAAWGCQFCFTDTVLPVPCWEG